MTHQFVVPAWARLGTAAVMAAAVLSGCTGSEPDPGPTGATATSPTESATESPTPTEEPTETSALPPLPEEATENTPEGAEAFIRYYFDVANEAYTTPRTGLIPPLSDPDCIACIEMENRVAEMSRNGQRAERAPFELVKLEPVGGGAPAVTSFNVELRQPANRVLDNSGGTVAEGADVLKTGVMAATWTGEQWLFYDSGVQ